VTRTRSGFLFALVGVVIFSFTLPMVKIALPSLSPWTITLGRMAIAGTTALIVLTLRKTPLPDRSLWRTIFYTGLGISLGFPIFSTLALQRTTSAHAAVIIAGLPLATAVLAVLRHKEKVAPMFWFGAVIGSLTLMVYAWHHGGSQGADPVADVLLIGAVLSSAFGYSEGAILTRSMPGWQVVSWCVVMFLPVSSIGAIATFFAGRQTHTVELKGFLAFLFVSFGSMYLGFFAWYRGLSVLGVARGSQVQLIQPIMTLLWSSLLLGEHIGATSIIAAVIVLSCVLLTQRARHFAVIAPAD